MWDLNAPVDQQSQALAAERLTTRGGNIQINKDTSLSHTFNWRIVPMPAHAHLITLS